MEDNTQDVNTDTHQAAEPSTGAPEQATETQATESAETLNTEASESSIPEHVPYGRFKEVNDKQREYAQKLEEYKAKEELYAAVEQFDSLLQQDSDLRETVEKALKQAAEGKKTQQAQQAQTQQQLTDYQRVTYDRYTMDFQAKMKAEGIPEKHHERVMSMVYSEAGKLNPNALNQYDPSLLDKAYAQVSDFLSGIKQQANSQYVETKKGDETPPSATKSGATPIKTQQFNGRGDRMSYLANGLKAGS